MSDSVDDDWFTKDICDFVVPVRRTDDNIEINESTELIDSNSFQNFCLINDTDYGGNCAKPIESNRSDSKSKITKCKTIGQQHVQRMSYKKMQEILRISPLNIFIEISQPQSGFFTLLSEYQLCLEDLNCILEIYIALFSLELTENRLSLLKAFCQNDNLWNEIFVTAKNLVNDFIPVDNLLLNLNNFWDSLEIILNNNLIQCIAVDTPCSKFVVQIVDFLKSKNNNLNDKLEMLQRINEIFENSTKTIDIEEIYPSLTELKSTVPNYIKPNLINGCYKSVEDYLKIHRSLLREDFIIPLKELILNFTVDAPHCQTVQIKLNTVKQLKQYSNLVLLDLFPDNRNKSLMKKFYSENNKYYKNGALLCLTKSVEFNDLILAISRKNLNQLEDGYLPIEIIKFSDSSNLFNSNFIMFEIEVFFEPYHQVYNVLKTINNQNFPMENYIINLNQNDNLPDYLADRTNEKILYTLNKYVHFDINNVSSWPNEEKFAMNKSQLKAYQYALTRKFSLIQGPPGTGKTYVGLKLVETLLQNTNLQILIVCYTNHTLDQFLNGLKEITQSIVRFGAQSKDTSLDNFNIRNLKQSNPTDTKLNNLIYLTHKKYIDLINQLELMNINNDNNIDINEVIKLQNDLKLVSDLKYEMLQIEYYQLIKNKRVIGMTTTCSARLNKMLKLLQTPIVIIEEAAQIMESHVIASLTKYTQHAVLIGDHKQLRPTTSVYRLAKEYNMDISLFERMIKNNINCASLTIQKRMRPEIASLLRPLIYKDLEDDECVKHYADILGVEMNLYLVKSANEDSKIKDKTRLNINEAKFLIAFANYLVMQGNKCSDITVLSFYSGQLTEMLNERNKYPLLADISILSVDNFQGDENEIILLSLVRSSRENKIGFMGFSNRICVALSRAKRGLFINGNIDFLVQYSNYWLNIKQKLEQMNAISTNLPLLLCSKHNQKSVVSTYHDLEKLQMNGLCNEKCLYIMECGHECVKLCHNIFNLYYEHKCLLC